MPAVSPPLMQAVYEENISLIKNLLINGAAVDERDGTGATALMRAHTREIALLLITAGANVNAQDIYKSSAVMHTTDHPEAMEVLLEKGADPNVQNTGGDTALIWSGRYGREVAVEALLRYGADPSLKNKAGETVRSAAQDRNHPNVIKVLEKVAEERITAKKIHEDEQHNKASVHQERLKKIPHGPKLKSKP